MVPPLMDNRDVIKATKVSKSFGDFKALNEFSCTIRKGECFGLLGPNGAGKSTFINLLYGVLARSDGDLTVFGMDPSRDARAIKRRLGVVTQDNALDESLTVLENMQLYSAFVEVPRSVQAERIDHLLGFMNLNHKRTQPIRTLSGGMKRRLVFVRALLSDPDVVILDEPTTGLDPAVRHLLWGKISELKERGKTILLTTHYMHEAEVLCDRLVIMNGGQVVSDGSPKELLHQHTPGYVGVFEKSLAASEHFSILAERQFHVLEDSSGLYVRAPELADLLRLQEDFNTKALQLRPAHLEDVFLKLTGKELTADA
ncbi:MAG: ABC transporter ATP-binding protein [Bdellovibrionales bacterium]